MQVSSEMALNEPFLRPMEKLSCDPAYHGSVYYAQENCKAPCLSEPMCHGLRNSTRVTRALGSSVLDQKECEEQKRVSKAIIRTRLSNDEPLQILGNILVGKLPLHY